MVNQILLLPIVLLFFWRGHNVLDGTRLLPFWAIWRRWWEVSICIFFIIDLPYKKSWRDHCFLTDDHFQRSWKTFWPFHHLLRKLLEYLLVNLTWQHGRGSLLGLTLIRFWYRFQWGFLRRFFIFTQFLLSRTVWKEILLCLWNFVHWSLEREVVIIIEHFDGFPLTSESLKFLLCLTQSEVTLDLVTTYILRNLAGVQILKYNDHFHVKHFG